MECRFCKKTFNKGEHLRRHERSHTGQKPFVCKVCKRPFSRQDSLLRHERLHTRPGPTSTSLSSNLANGPLTPESLKTAPSVNGECDLSTSPTSAPETGTVLPNDSQATAAPLSDSLDLDFDLLWPDSEDLFQSIMSPAALSFTTDLSFDLGSTAAGCTFPSTPASPTFEPSHRAASIDNLPAGGNHAAVHDVSRLITSWSSSITTAAQSSAIKSVFLDECLHMFFVKFIPTFPVIHRATFVFKDCIHPLLLNAIAIGSLYLGPKDAVAKGEVLWRLAHTAVTTNWQRLITHRGPYDACQGVQLIITALLSQVYGALSKDRTIRTMSKAFHSLGLTWANLCGMFDSPPYETALLPSTATSPAEKEFQWRHWVAREMQHRALLAHYTLDGLIAQMNGKQTAARHASNNLHLSTEVSDRAFVAGSADEWLEAMLSGQQTLQPQLTFRSIYRALFSSVDDSRWLSSVLTASSLRVVLEGTQSLLSDCEDGDLAIGAPTKHDIRRALSRLHDFINSDLTLNAADRLESLLRWHTISLDTIINTHNLGQYLCKRNSITEHVFASTTRSPNVNIDFTKWAGSQDARKALLHAVAIHDIVESLPRGRAHAIHMPSSLFAAATIYTVFLLAGVSTVRIPSNVDWEDVVSPSVPPLSPFSHPALSESTGLTLSAGDSRTRKYIRGEILVEGFGPSSQVTMRNILYEFNSMQKLFGCLSTQWGVARDMEEVLEGWITLCH